MTSATRIPINLIGGSGFIGSRLARRLMCRDRYSVTLLDLHSNVQSESRFIYTDVTSLDSLLSGVDDGAVLVNLAAEHRDDVDILQKYHDVNVQGAINICEVAEAKSVDTIVFLSSVAVYGFAPVGADESCAHNPFNEYGRTKSLAESVFREWQLRLPNQRKLVIVRPTVVFGEGNRGNVYNLIQQVHSGTFLMIGSGDNRKSLAYVENVAAFIEHCLDVRAGVHIFNYVDKPDFDMTTLVSCIHKFLGKSPRVSVRIPFWFGLLVGFFFDALAKISGKRFSISSVRVRKFCANSVYGSSIEKTGFVPPIPLVRALQSTIRRDFGGSNL